jgi:hypothetical protein
MSASKLALTLCLALSAYAIAGPEVQAGARSVGCAGLPACGIPELADDFGCAEPVAASCGGERSILLVRGDGPLRRLLRGSGRLLTPFDGSRTFRPQPRFHRRHSGYGCG